MDMGTFHCSQVDKSILWWGDVEVTAVILCLWDPHHLFLVTAPTNARWDRDSNRSRKFCVSSKEALNFRKPARLDLLTNRRMTLTSRCSVYATQWNVGHVTKSVAALLTLCPYRIWHRQRANYLAMSTSPSLGDPDETCRPSRDGPSSRLGCFHVFLTL